MPKLGKECNAATIQNNGSGHIKHISFLCTTENRFICKLDTKMLTAKQFAKASQLRIHYLETKLANLSSMNESCNTGKVSQQEEDDFNLNAGLVFIAVFMAFIIIGLIGYAGLLFKKLEREMDRNVAIPVQMVQAVWPREAMNNIMPNNHARQMKLGVKV